MKIILDRFLKNVAVVASGNAMAQLIFFISTIILVRIFEPDSFGLLAVFSATVGIFSAIINLRYDQAIVIEKSFEHAFLILYLCIIFSIVFFSFSLIVIFLFENQIASLLSFDISKNLTFLIPFYILFYGFFLALNQWATRQKYFYLIASYHIIRALVICLTQIVLGFLGLGGAWLVIGFVFGQSVSSIYFFAKIYVSDSSFFKSLKIDITKVLHLTKKYKKFAHFSTPQTLFNSLSLYLPSLILAAFFSPAIVGTYYLTLRVLQAPSTLLGQAIRQPFYKEVNEIINEGSSPRAFFFKYTIALFIIGLIIFTPIILFGPEIFKFFFGEAFRLSGTFGQWISLWLWATLANIPAICTLHAIQALKELFVWELSLFILRIGGLFYFSLTGSASTAIAVFSIIGMVFNLFIIYFTIIKLKSFNKLPNA